MVHAGVFRIKGQSSLEIPIDREKCALWGVSVADVQNTIQAAIGGRAATQMTEGGMTYDITVRYPERLRNNVESILDIPVDVGNNQVSPRGPVTQNPTPVSGGSTGASSTGASLPLAAVTGSAFNAPTIPNQVPQRRLGDLVSPVIEGAARASSSGLPAPSIGSKGSGSSPSSSASAAVIWPARSPRPNQKFSPDPSSLPR